MRKIIHTLFIFSYDLIFRLRVGAGGFVKTLIADLFLDFSSASALLFNPDTLLFTVTRYMGYARYKSGVKQHVVSEATGHTLEETPCIYMDELLINSFSE